MKAKKFPQSAPFIRKENFRLFFPEIKETSYDQNIKNWLKSGKLITLKRGVYVLDEYWQRCPDKTRYLEYLASVVYAPSYISCETALSRYGMLTEAVFGISSVALKTARVFNSRLARFSYTKIKEALFTGFKNEMFSEGSSYPLASKSKALFDYLYFLKRRLHKIDPQTVDELRLNFDLMTKEDWQEFEKYLSLAHSTKMYKMYHLIQEAHFA